MTIKHIRGTQRDAYGTSLTGYLSTTYDALVERLGMPNIGPNDDRGDKTTCEWILKFNGHVVTIYDYKMGRTPFHNYDWHIGSKRPFAEIGQFVPGSRSA